MASLLFMGPVFVTASTQRLRLKNNFRTEEDKERWFQSGNTFVGYFSKDQVNPDFNQQHSSICVMWNTRYNAHVARGKMTMLNCVFVISDTGIFGVATFEGQSHFTEQLEKLENVSAFTGEPAFVLQIQTENQNSAERLKTFLLLVQSSDVISFLTGCGRAATGNNFCLKSR